MTASEHRRYPGWRSFGDDTLDGRLFFGRDTERGELLHLVLSHDLVVLYAKSGAGKTSLVNVALMQPLRSAHGPEGDASPGPNDAPAYYFPIVARVNDPKAGPFSSLVDSVREAAASRHVECEVVPGSGTSLSDFFSGLKLWSGDQLLLPVVILDQFEELFTLQEPGPRSDFGRQLGELLRGQDHRFGPPCLKVVVSIREDYLGNLEELARQLPAIFTTRFRLDALQRAAARQAIIEPARLPDPSLASAPFDYAPETVERLLDFLCRRRVGSAEVVTAAVEPFQLQLVCEHAEDVALARQRAGLAAPPLTYEDLGGDEGLRSVLGDYYERQVRERPDARRIYALCEKGLISARGRRLSLEEEEIGDRFHLPPATLRFLVERHLLRAEPRLGSRSYELSHDTLVDPIQRARFSRLRSLARRRVTAAAGALAALALLALAVHRTGWYQTRSAVAEGGALLEAIEKSASVSEGDAWKAHWSQALAWNGRAEAALGTARLVESDELRARTMLGLLEAPSIRAEADTADLRKRLLEAVSQVRDLRDHVELMSAVVASPQALSESQATEQWEAARTLAARADPFVAAQALVGAADVMLREGHPSRALEALQGAAESARNVPEATDRFSMTMQVASAFLRIDRREDVVAAVKEARSFAASLPDPRLLGAVAEILAQAGARAEANRDLALARSQAMRLPDPRLRAEALAALFLNARRGTMAEAVVPLHDAAILAALAIPSPADRTAAFTSLLTAVLDPPAGFDANEVLNASLANAKQEDGLRRVETFNTIARLCAHARTPRASQVADEAASVAREWSAGNASAEGFKVLVEASRLLGHVDLEKGITLRRELSTRMAQISPDQQDWARREIVQLMVDQGSLEDAIAAVIPLAGSLGDTARLGLVKALVRDARKPSSPHANETLRAARGVARAIIDAKARSAAVGEVAAAEAWLGRAATSRSWATDCQRLEDRLRVQIGVLLAAARAAHPTMRERIDALEPATPESEGENGMGSGEVL